jgi:hypothetical protein
MRAIGRRDLLVAAGLLLAGRPLLAAGGSLQVWKTRGCGCCTAWVKRLTDAGFTASVTEVDDLPAVHRMFGVPEDLGSCHTAKLEGYALEGHVPVEAVQRLLAERPPILGLAVPGMPTGSPGMEVEGMPADPYDVIAFAADGSRTVFMAVRPTG